MEDQPGTIKADVKPIGRLAAAAGLLELLLCAWWLTFGVWYRNLYSHETPTSNPSVQGQSSGMGVAFFSLFVFAISAFVAIHAVTLLFRNNFGRIIGIPVAVLTIFYGGTSVFSSDDQHMNLVGPLPVWVDVLLSGWTNILAGAALLTLLVVAHRRQSPSKRRAADGHSLRSRAAHGVF